VKGDTTRVTFATKRHATSVRKQQGRVDLDAEWNEQTDIEQHLRETSLADVVGHAGAPIDAAAFAMVPNGTDLKLSEGRYYVAGTVCECDTLTSVFSQPDLPETGPFVRRKDLTWLTHGTPVPPAVYAAWLHVWPQHRTAVEDPALREIALGGPDTTTRIRTAWQVRLLELGPLGTSFDCASEPTDWSDLTAPSTGTLAAWADPVGAQVDDCQVPLGSPYTGLDNLHFRVEIFKSGGPGVATYAYSRDNGSIVASWQDIDVDVMTVVSPGRDGSSGFTNGCWVELTDDTHEQLGKPGTLVQVESAHGDQLVIKTSTAIGTLDKSEFPLNRRVRRWDGRGTVPSDGSEVALELGVKVRFGKDGGMTYRCGDWWSFPARAAIRNIEWPKVGNQPEDMTPHGPVRADTRLAVVSFDDSTWTVVRDCRPVFAPLADHVALFMLSGDGQQVAPNVANPTALVPLGHDLQVGVSTGGRPLAKARVSFAVSAGSGKLKGVGNTVTIETDVGGVAKCSWELDSTTPVQEVTVRLRDDNGAPHHLPIRFVASLARADLVSYDPKACADLAGANTVQAALDRLCQSTGGGCATLTLSPGPDWVTALTSLPAGKDAVVCFRPGDYAAGKAVSLASLGHVELHGGGPATRILIAEDESGLAFTKCASVSLQRLSIEIQRLPAAPKPGKQGVVTIVDCPEVTVDQMRLICPADAGSRINCLTVRTATTSSVASVRVLQSDLVVGHAQDGVLLVNVDRAVVRDCTFRTPPKPASLDFARLMKDTRRRKRLVHTMVYRMLVEPLDQMVAGGFNTSLLAKDYAIRLNSTVPEGEWRSLASANPPTEVESASVAAMQGYVNRLVDIASAAPTKVPTYSKQLNLLKGQLGDSSSQVFDTTAGKQTLRNMLVGGGADIRFVTDLVVAPRNVRLRIGNTMYRFDSPLSQQTWQAMVTAVPPPSTTTDAAVVKHLRSLAERILLDAAFGKQFATPYLNLLISRNAAASAHGVVVGGAVVGELEVSGCRILGASDGVHVAASTIRAPGGPVVSARSVQLRGNEIRLAIPMELALAPRGVFVGNTTRAVVAENRITVDGSGALVGIEVDGVFGPQVAVRDNLVEKCKTAVIVRPHVPLPGVRLWSATDNVAPGAYPVVNAPATVRNTGNVG
jgi:hypothetical protein